MAAVHICLTYIEHLVPATGGKNGALRRVEHSHRLHRRIMCRDLLRLSGGHVKEACSIVCATRNNLRASLRVTHKHVVECDSRSLIKTNVTLFRIRFTPHESRYQTLFQHTSSTGA